MRILICDNNVPGCNALAVGLRLDGSEVLHAYTGSSALEAARAGGFDAVMLDIDLPDGDGWALAREVRHTPGSRDALLIAFTGRRSEAYRARSARAGFNHHLVKPAMLDRIQALLRSARRASTATPPL